MRYSVADCVAESKHENLGSDKERGAECNIADGPSVFQGSKDEDELRDDVDDNADQRPEEIYDPESDRIQ